MIRKKHEIMIITQPQRRDEAIVVQAHFTPDGISEGDRYNTLREVLAAGWQVASVTIDKAAALYVVQREWIPEVPDDDDSDPLGVAGRW